MATDAPDDSIGLKRSESRKNQLVDEIYQALNLFNTVPKSTSLQNATSQQLSDRPSGLNVSRLSHAAVEFNTPSSAGSDCGTPSFGTMPDLAEAAVGSHAASAAYPGSPQAYCDEWHQLFMRSRNNQAVLRQMALHGVLHRTHFRSICWRLYLEILPFDVKQWMDRTRYWRKKYDGFRRKCIVDPHESQPAEASDLGKCNPLSLHDDNPWNKYFRGAELRQTIEQDVVRTFPENEFFQDDKIRTILINVLFCYCKSFQSHLSEYKQGMHEILAPIVFVLNYDHVVFKHALESAGVQENVSELARVLLDPEYIEHDAFAIFYEVMDVIEPWYTHNHMPYSTSNDPIQMQPFQRPQETMRPIPVVSKMTRIFDTLLKKVDPELYAQLERLEISPQVFGVRWLRLLFGREFTFPDQLLLVWDAIFAFDKDFNLVDYMVIAMLLRIRNQLLTTDFTGALTCVMRYPSISDVSHLIQTAIDLSTGQPLSKVRMHLARADNSPMRKPSWGPHMDTLKEMPSSQSDMTLHVGRRGSSAKHANFAKNSSAAAQPSALLANRHREMAIGGIKDIHSPQMIRSGEIFAYDGGQQNSTLSEAGDDQPFLPTTLSEAHRQLFELRGANKDCAATMDVCLEKLQTIVINQTTSIDHEDQFFVSLAVLKQVRDVLSGSLVFSRDRLIADGLFTDIPSAAAPPSEVAVTSSNSTAAVPSTTIDTVDEEVVDEELEK